MYAIKQTIPIFCLKFRLIEIGCMAKFPPILNHNNAYVPKTSGKQQLMIKANSVNPHLILFINRYHNGENRTTKIKSLKNHN